MQMVLAPQLRQSLEMLQAPVLELRALIREEMENNPTLEEGAAREASLESAEVDLEKRAADDAEFRDQFEVLAKLDDEWRDYFRQSQTAMPYSPEREAHRQFMLDSLTQAETLQEHLLSQLHLAADSPETLRVGELIVGSINDDGYLSSPPEELAASTGTPPDTVQAVLRLIRGFDPVGVGALNLRECLLLQLEYERRNDPLAEALVRDHLDDLAAHRYPVLARALGADVDAVKEAARHIAALDPKPGRRFSAEAPAYVLPEITVQKIDGEYLVTMDREQLPHLRISDHYRRLMEDPATTAEVRQYIKEKVRSGALLIRGIHQRQRTIYRIAVELVRVQQAFFDHGISRLKPLTMAQVADALGLHETTISRAVSGKYMQTPLGVFELKYFFAPGYRTAEGEEVSNRVIKDTLAQMVSDEDPSKPLSDQAIVARLKERGLTVARRTIAKYRDELNIPPSHLRRNL